MSCLWPKHNHWLWYRCPQLGRVTDPFSVAGEAKAEWSTAPRVQSMDVGAQRGSHCSSTTLCAFRYSEALPGGGAAVSSRAEASIPTELQMVGAALWVPGCRESLEYLPEAGELVPSPMEVCCCWGAVSPVEELERKWTGCAMSERIREWSTAATRTGKKTCVAKQMVLTI